MPQKRNLKSPYVLKDKRQIEFIARQIRTYPSIEDVYAPNIGDILASARKFIPRLRVKRVPDEKLPVAEAWANCKTRVVHVRESVWKAAEKYGDGRARWTIAHELGHIALGHPGSQFRNRPNAHVRESSRSLEREANIFAAELLV